MSIEAMSHVWKHTPYSRSCSYVLLAVADEVDEDYVVFLNIEHLAAKTKQSSRNIQRVLRRFEKDGWLVQASEKGDSVQNRYLFMFIYPQHIRVELLLYKKRVIPLMVRLMVFARDGYKCKSCGSRKNLTIDHIHPESKGGTDDPNNLQTLCGSCNSRKGVKVPV